MLFASNNNKAVVLPGGGQLIRSRVLLMPKWWLIGRNWTLGQRKRASGQTIGRRKKAKTHQPFGKKKAKGCDTINYSGPMIYGITD
jgi:hypothetical protein